MSKCPRQMRQPIRLQIQELGESERLLMSDQGTTVSISPVDSWHIKSLDVFVMITSSNYFCFHAGSKKFTQETGLSGDVREFMGEHPEAYREYLRCVNWSLKMAQSYIIDIRLRVEATRRSGTLQIDAPYTFGYIIKLLTDFADSIAWGLLLFDLSLVRNQFLDLRSHSDLEMSNWPSIETVLEMLNDDPDQIALATDITSFMHVGDIFLRNSSTGRAGTIEVKTGKENERVLAILSAADADEFKKRLDTFIADSKDPKRAFQQVERNLKQHDRHIRSKLYSDSLGRKRVDLKSSETVYVNETEFEDHWHRAVLRAIDEIGKTSKARGVVEECLFFEYGTGIHTRERHDDFRSWVIDSPGTTVEEGRRKQMSIFNVGLHLATPLSMPQSINLRSLGEKRQVRLLTLQEYLLVYLHVPRLTEMLAKRGIEMSLHNIRKHEHEFADPLTRAVFGANKIPYLKSLVGESNIEVSVFGGMTGRILFGFHSPLLFADAITNIPWNEFDEA